MATLDRGERWESDFGPLALRRSIESLDGSEVLVRLTFENTDGTPIAARIIEDVPARTIRTTAITTAGGDPDAYRHVGDWIIHDVVIPAETERRTAYLLELDDEGSVSIAPPRVRTVESMGEDDLDDDPIEGSNHRRLTTGGASARVAIAEAESDGIADVSLQSTEEDGDSIDGEAVIDALLEALETDDEDRRRELQAKLGVGPSERARIEYVQSRLDDLAAYVEALELLIDEHGTDVVGDLRESIAGNHERALALREDVDGLDRTVTRHRADTVEEIGAIKAEVADLDVRLDARLEDVETALAAAETERSELRDERRADRQARTREVQRIEESLGSIRDSVDDLESNVAQFQAFHDRFTAAFRSDPLAGDEGPATETTGNDSADDGTDATDGGADVVDGGADVTDSGADVADGGADVADDTTDAVDATSGTAVGGSNEE